VASYVVGLMTRFIVKGYQNSTIETIRKLYERREANAQWGTPEHSMLRQARIDSSRVEPGYKGNPLGLPTFLLGGAAISSFASGLTALFDVVFHNVVAFIATVTVLGLLFLSLAWCALFSASVARRRIRLSTQQPLKALWETIGACGDPPHDTSYSFAAYAIVLLVAAGLLVPAAIALLFGGFQAGMPVLGWALGATIASHTLGWCHWVTFAVLGGIGNLAGAMLGGMLLGIVEALGAGYIGDFTNNVFGSNYQDVFAFLVLIGVLVFRPSGLLGERIGDRA
jgi:hypothetical protein